MSEINFKEWELARHLYDVTRDTPEETRLNQMATSLPGFDRHSYGMIIATTEQIEKYQFMNYETYPGANMISREGKSLYSSNIDAYMRQIRNKEGVSLIELDDTNASIVKNGIILPSAKIDDIKETFNVNTIEKLTDKLELSEEVGGKTLALMLMAVSNPEVLFARLDGQNYLFKGYRKINIETSKITDLISPLVKNYSELVSERELALRGVA